MSAKFCRINSCMDIGRWICPGVRWGRHCLIILYLRNKSKAGESQKWLSVMGML